LPNTAENQRFLTELLAHVSEESAVVVVDCPPPSEISIPDSGRVQLLSTLRSDADAAVQTGVLARASAFVGSHGDLGVMASFCGTPAFTYHSERLPVDQLERLEAATAQAGWGAVTLQRSHRFKRVHLPRKAHA
jgi:hypothetical protein